MTLSVHQSEVISRRQVLGGMLAGAVAAALPIAPVFADPTRIAALTGRAAGSHALGPALEMARESLQSMSSVKDYTALLFKQEQVGKQRIVHQMDLKLREEPFSVYLKFRNPHEGREAIFVDGSNGGMMLAHGTGIEAIAGTVKLEPSGKRALEESRYPVTMIGRRRMLESLLAQWESELDLTGVNVRYFPNAKVEDIDCRVFETSYATPGKGIKFHMTRLYVGRNDKSPVRVEQFDFAAKTGAQAPLVEQYTYLNVRTNVGLGDIDFDVANPAYSY